MTSIFRLILFIPIFVFLAWVLNAKYESYRSIGYVADFFEKYPDTLVLELNDFNEEFPLCCPEVSAKLRIGSNTIELSDLNKNSFESDARFMIFAVNGRRLDCSIIGGSTIMGISARGFPDVGYSKLHIESVEDILLRSDELFEYFSGWPDSPNDGIPITYNLDTQSVVRKCHLGKRL